MPLAVFNADGTPYDPPVTQEYRDMVKKLKTCDYGPDYSCMYCGKCPFGEYFKCPEEYKQVMENQKEAVRKYNLLHGNTNPNSIFLTET